MKHLKRFFSALAVLGFVGAMAVAGTPASASSYGDSASVRASTSGGTSANAKHFGYVKSTTESGAGGIATAGCGCMKGQQATVDVGGYSVSSVKVIGHARGSAYSGYKARGAATDNSNQRYGW